MEVKLREQQLTMKVNEQLQQHQENSDQSIKSKELQLKQLEERLVSMMRDKEEKEFHEKKEELKWKEESYKVCGFLYRMNYSIYLPAREFDHRIYLPFPFQLCLYDRDGVGRRR